MDSERFDGLVRRFGQTRSRRQTLRGLAAAVAVGAHALGQREASAQACKRNGKPCKKNNQCCSNTCVGASGGTVNDGTCQDVSDECTGVADGTPCGGAGSGLRCCNGTCPSPPTCRPLGTPCGAEETQATCAAQCCTGNLLCGQNGCTCANSYPGVSAPCGSDADCGQGFGPAECRCGRCCIPTGGRAGLTPDGCQGCCSGTCRSGSDLCT